MKTIKIHTPYITLGQLLKFIGIISNGSEIKSFLKNNKILLEGEVENRRGKKIYKDMVVEINNEKYLIALEEQND